MPQKPGRPVGEMLWIVPRFVETPSALIKLGSILTNPENPESSLNLHAIPEIEPSRCRDATPHVRQYVHSEMQNSNSVLANVIPTLPLVSGGLSGEARAADTVEATFHAEDVKAEVFMADKAWMDRALQHEAVIKYARDCLFSKSLYLIVGVATAGKFSLEEKQGSDRGAAASAHVAAPGSVGEAETKLNHERQGKVESELVVENGCDFAYRLREFVYTRIRGGLKDKGDYSSGAMFGQDGGSGKPDADAQTGVEDVPGFLFMEDEDESPNGITTFAVPEENQG